jgi:hypothetical protein
VATASADMSAANDLGVFMVVLLSGGNICKCLSRDGKSPE